MDYSKGIDKDDDWDFLYKHLVPTGQVYWVQDGVWSGFHVKDTNLILDDSWGQVWCLYTRPFRIGVKMFHNGLAKDWPSPAELQELDKQGKEADEKFRQTDDF